MKTKNFTVFFTLLFFLFSIPTHAQWEPQGLGLLPDNYGVFAISAVDENVVWAVAGDQELSDFKPKMLRTLDGGENWEMVNIEEANGYLIFDIEGRDDATALISGIHYGATWTTKLFKTTDGGDTWEAIAQTAAKGLEMAFFDDLNGFSVINDISTTSDGGNTWTKVPGSNWPGLQSGEGFASYAGNNNLITLGDTAWFGTTKRVFRSTDKGLHWEAFEPPAEVKDIPSIAFKDAQHGIAVSPADFGVFLDTVVLISTSDGGATWELLPTPPFSHLTCIEYVPGTENTYIGVSGTITDGMAGFPSFDPISAFTTDGGYTWHIIDYHGYNAVSFLDEQTGWTGKVSESGEAAMYKWNGSLSTIINPKTAPGIITCYPNPCQDEVHIRLENDWTGQLDLQLLNADGKVLHMLSLQKWEQQQEYTLPVSDLAPGLYWVRLVADGRQQVASFAKN